MVIENEGPLSENFYFLNGRGVPQEVGSTTHLLTFSCALGTGLGATVGKETPRSCVPDGGLLARLWSLAVSFYI